MKAQKLQFRAGFGEQGQGLTQPKDLESTVRPKAGFRREELVQRNNLTA